LASGIPIPETSEPYPTRTGLIAAEAGFSINQAPTRNPSQFDFFSGLNQWSNYGFPLLFKERIKVRFK
jgi:hypothetical protein